MTRPTLAEIAPMPVSTDTSHQGDKTMNIDDLTIGQAKAIAAQFGAPVTHPPIAANIAPEHAVIPVLVCTDKRGVVFGLSTGLWLARSRARQALAACIGAVLLADAHQRDAG